MRPEHASPIPIMRNVYHIMYKTNNLSLIEVLVVHSVEHLPAVRRVTDSIRPVGESGFFQSLVSNRMRTRPALTTVLKHVERIGWYIKTTNSLGQTTPLKEVSLTVYSPFIEFAINVQFFFKSKVGMHEQFRPPKSKISSWDMFFTNQLYNYYDYCFLNNKV